MGYIAAWPLSAWLIGTLVERAYRRTDYPSPLLILGCILAGSFAFVHPLGILGMWWRIPGATLMKAIANDLKFWPGDLVKSLAAAFIAVGVHRSFPACSPSAETCAPGPPYDRKDHSHHEAP